MRLAPTSGEIVQTFLDRWFSPTQRQLDMLLNKCGVPTAALMHDSDGAGYPMGMLRIERGRRTFEFSEDPDLKPVCGFIAWDRDGEAQDLVAWSPRDNWCGTWLGHAALLNEHEIHAPRLDEFLPVHLDLLSWLRAARSGCAILDPKRARTALEGMKVAAASIEDGLALRRLLTPPQPRIVVPASARETVKEAA